jgi:hypothetical protein
MRSPKRRLEHEAMDSSGWKFDLCFGSHQPRLGDFPHIISKNDQPDKTLKIIATAVNGPVGIWGDEPRTGDKGAIFIAPSDGKMISSFSLWKEPANQEYALNPSRFGRSYGFRMYIAADTSAAVLEHIDDTQIDRDYYPNIERVCGWLNDLGWVYIELSDEAEYAIFSTSRQNASLFQEVTQALKTSLISVGSLVRKGTRFKWPDI